VVALRGASGGAPPDPLDPAAAAAFGVLSTRRSSTLNRSGPGVDARGVPATLDAAALTLTAAFLRLMLGM
jgi:hypothetical protein